MPVTRKGAGGANASTRMRFSGPTTAMKERRRRDTRIKERSRIATQRAENEREERERPRERRSRAVGSSVFIARDAASRVKMKRVRSGRAPREDKEKKIRGSRASNDGRIRQTSRTIRRSKSAPDRSPPVEM